MTVIAPKQSKGAAWVKFENPLDVRVMAIDGTWCRDCQLTQVSETEAQIRLIGPGLNDNEFFLLLTKLGNPVFRMCRRRWVNGNWRFVPQGVGRRLLAQLGREAAVCLK
jgi:hypothetical protein